MTQIYGCIECGMLFAGWEYCLAHIEHCRPQHYLEVDKKTLQQLCMIGHSRCIVPSYRPTLIEGDSSSEGDDEYNLGQSISKSSSDGSAGETTLTQDFLNPVDEEPQQRMATLGELDEGGDEAEQRDDEEECYRERNEEEDDDEVFDVQEKMIIQLFDREGQDNSIENRVDVTPTHPMKFSGDLEEDKSGLKANSQTVKEDSDSRQKQLRRIENRLHRLINEASPISADKPNMLLLEILPRVYEVQFGNKLDFEALGFHDMKALLDSIPSVAVVVDSPYLGIEHEYLRLADSSNGSLISEESDDDSLQEKNDKYTSSCSGSQALQSQEVSSSDSVGEPTFAHEKTPLHANNHRAHFSFSKEKHGSFSEESLSLQPISDQHSPTNSNSGSRRRKEPVIIECDGNQKGGDDEQSTTSSKWSSCGSSMSVINAIAEMLPTSHAYSSILRVLSKNPNGITIGTLMVHAPEFHTFLSHVTDRRCEAQVKLAHSVLQQCQGISYRRAGNGTILYTKAPRTDTAQPPSIVTSINESSQQGNQQGNEHQKAPRYPGTRPFSGFSRLETDDSSQPKLASPELIHETAAKLFAASEFLTPTPSPREGLSSASNANSAERFQSNVDDIFRRPTHLDTIAAPLQRTPRQSSTASPANSRESRRVSSWHGHSWATPPVTPRSTMAQSPSYSRAHSPATTMSREQSIAESAARILAEAQALATPKATILADSHSLTTPTQSNTNELPHFPIPYPVARISSEYPAKASSNARDEPHTVTPNKGPTDGSRMYFFTDLMSPEPDEKTLASLGAASSVTDHSVSSVADEARESDPETRVSIDDNVASKAVGNSNRFQPTPVSVASQEQMIEKLAVEILPTTNIYDKLLVALAEHPDGMTLDQIDTLIPPFSGYVAKYSAEQGVEAIDRAAVLQACVNVIRKQKEGTMLYFINSPDMMESQSTPRSGFGSGTPSATRLINRRGDEISTTSDMTESSTLSNSTVLEEPSLFSLAYIGSDILSTLFFLRMLKEGLRDQPWPACWEQAYQSLLRFDNEESHDHGKNSLSRWLEMLGEGDSAPYAPKTRRRALNLLLYYLQRLKCVTRKGPHLCWHQKEITTTLALPVTAMTQLPSKLNYFLGKTPVFFIETNEHLDRAKQSHPFCSYHEEDTDPPLVTVICEGAPDRLYVIQIGTESITYIFDCVKLGAKAVCAAISNLLQNKTIIKAFHDLHYSAVALAKIGCVVEPLRNVFDSQIAMEALTGVRDMSFNRMLHQLGIAAHPMSKKLAGRRDVFRERPIAKDLIAYAADHVDLLSASSSTLKEILQKPSRSNKLELWNSIRSASELRAAMAVEKDGRRSICFDASNHSTLASLELLQVQRPSDILECSPLSFSNDAGSLLSLLPGELVENVSAIEFHENVTSIMLDLGRPALAWFDDHQRINLGAKDRFVTAADIVAVTDSLDGFKDNDNRGGLKGQLHTVSSARNRNQEIIGLTMRVGKHVTGVACMIADLLFADPTKSILFIGESGAGKTTALRDVARILSEQTSVSIVDTHCEIGGYCDTPHASVGISRRFMVGKREEQASVMMHCFQSQRPRVMVIDEVDSESDVIAAVNCHRRGVRLIAGTTGSLSNIMDDDNLAPLLGASTMSETGRRSTSRPVFDAIVELKSGALNEWRIITDTMDAVDSIKDHRHYLTQLRIRDPEKGTIQLECERVFIG